MYGGCQFDRTGRANRYYTTCFRFLIQVIYILLRKTIVAFQVSGTVILFIIITLLLDL